MRESVIKDGRVMDSMLYATLRSDRKGGRGKREG
jgi:hypothetical protein